MRCLTNLQKTYFYAPYLGKVAMQDEYGNETGEYELTYGKPTEFHASKSAAKGLSETLQFGETLVYDKTLVMEKLPDGFDEYSLLWIDAKPELVEETGELKVNKNGDVVTPHDYEVSKIADGNFYVSVAVARVQVK